MQYGLIFIMLYAIIVPATNLGVQLTKRWLQQMMYGRRSKTAYRQEVKKETFASKLYKRLKFTIREDKRSTKGVSNKLIVISILLIGALVAFLAGTMQSWSMLFLAIIIQLIGLGISSAFSKAILTKREEILDRMLSLKQQRMGIIGDAKKGVHLAENIKVIEWGEDYIHPAKLHMYMPTSFDSPRVSDFMTFFNQLFNTKGVWVQNLNDEQYEGFDFQAGVASLRVTPPLPGRADWHERYLFDDNIAWSFFPLALGSEGGVPITNPETGAIEHILGFDVNGEQGKLMGKRGLHAGPDMTASPQALVAGATGGGKSLAENTIVATVTE